MNVLKILLFILDSLGEQNKTQSEDNKINLKDLIKKKDLKSGTKVVLVFKEVSNLESIMKDIPYEESTEAERKENNNKDGSKNEDNNKNVDRKDDDIKKVNDKNNSINDREKDNKNNSINDIEKDNKNNSINDNMDDTKIKDEVTELISKSLSKLLQEETKEKTDTQKLDTSDIKLINHKLNKPKTESHKLNTSDIELLNIPLGYKLLCILFKNLKLLEDSKKLKNVKITNLLITNKMTDIYDKLKFKKKPVEGLEKLKNNTDKFMDSTGYFTGDLYDKPLDEIGKIYKTGLFHFLNLTKEIEEQNNKGMRIIFKYIADLKKKSLKDLLNEDCELNNIDKILFYNNYDKNFIDKLNVCVCIEDLCGNCIGPYQIESGKLT